MRWRPLSPNPVLQTRTDRSQAGASCGNFSGISSHRPCSFSIACGRVVYPPHPSADDAGRMDHGAACGQPRCCMPCELHRNRDQRTYRVDQSGGPSASRNPSAIGTRRAVEPAGSGLTYRSRHKPSIVPAPRPAFDDMWHRERFQHLPHRPELAPVAHRAHQVVFPNIFACHERQSEWREEALLKAAICRRRVMRRSHEPVSNESWRYVTSGLLRTAPPKKKPTTGIPTVGYATCCL